MIVHQPISCKFRETSLQSNINIVLCVCENEGELDNISWSFPSLYFTVSSERCIHCQPKPTVNNFSPKSVYSRAWSVIFNRGVIQQRNFRKQVLREEDCISLSELPEMTVCNPMDTMKDVYIPGKLERKTPKALLTVRSHSQIHEL